MCIRFTKRYSQCGCEVYIEDQTYEFCREALFRHLKISLKFGLKFWRLKKGMSKETWKEKMAKKVELLNPEWRTQIFLYRHRCAEHELEDKGIPDEGYFKDGWCGLHRPDPRPSSSAIQEDLDELSQAPDPQDTSVSFDSILRFYSGTPTPTQSRPESPLHSLSTLSLQSHRQESQGSSTPRSAFETPSITLTPAPVVTNNTHSEFTPGMIGQAITTSATVTLLPGFSNTPTPAGPIAEQELHPESLKEDLESLEEDPSLIAQKLSTERLRKARSEQKLRKFYGSDVAAADVAGLFPRPSTSGVMRRPASSAWLRGI